MKKIKAITVLLFIYAFAYSQQTVTGTFPGLNNQTIKLYGFQGFNNYPIDSVKANGNGDFEISFGKKDFGMGYLIANDDKPFIVALAGEGLHVKGETFSNPESIKIVRGYENLLFGQYAAEHPRREQALSAWDYLEKIYTLDSLFAVQQLPKQAIIDEKLRIKAEDSLFLARLKPDSYMYWYLPTRKLVSSVSTVAQYRTQEIPHTVAAFRKMDYTDNRLYHSGLLRDAIDSHIWLIENSGHSLDSMYVVMNQSIDFLVENLLPDDKKLNEVTEYLFQLLEKRSLFNASEYLAIKLLNEKSCTINSDFAAQLESYRAMKKGNIAPDFEFKTSILATGYEVSKQPQKLSDLKSKYTVVVFGASWCPQCTTELSQMMSLYPKWKAQNIEIVFVSLDENENDFRRFATAFPFISICD
jgi:hypothetical protein